MGRRLAARCPPANILLTLVRSGNRYGSAATGLTRLLAVSLSIVVFYPRRAKRQFRIERSLVGVTSSADLPTRESDVTSNLVAALIHAASVAGARRALRKYKADEVAFRRSAPSDHTT
jgi:hypothetical protein